jgi:hypothetical protein
MSLWRRSLRSYNLPVSGVPLAGKRGRNAYGIAASIFSVTSGYRASSLPGMPPPAPNGALQMGLRSFFPHGLSDPARRSLWALAAVSLPASAGL